ncbi:hypothetical protein ACU686_41330 [Yinghuangia aomiensis]
MGVLRRDPRRPAPRRQPAPAAPARGARRRLLRRRHHVPGTQRPRRPRRTPGRHAHPRRPGQDPRPERQSSSPPSATSTGSPGSSKRAATAPSTPTNSPGASAAPNPAASSPTKTRALLGAAFAAAVRGHTGCADAAEVFTRKAKAADAAVAAIVAELGALEDPGTPDRDARIWALADRLGLGNAAAYVLLTGMGADGAPPERMVRMLRRIGPARARHLEAVRDFLWQEKVVAGALLAYESEDRRRWLAVLDPDNTSVPVWLRPYRILGSRHATGSLPTPGDAIAVADLTESGEEFTRVVSAFWPTFTETAGNEQYQARLFAALTRRHVADPDTAVRIDLLLVVGGYLPHGAEQRRLSVERYPGRGPRPPRARPRRVPALGGRLDRTRS